jgi:peptidoglycan/LPS O-acetylase OafA/YrhL
MNLSYIKAFDGLRAFALILVVLSHWPYRYFSVTFGWIGVSMFLVLSGFLITRILLVAKTKPLKTFLTQFYRNRALRILPLYYLYLLAVSAILIAAWFFTDPEKVTDIIAFGFIAVKNDMLYLLTYTYNFQDIWHLWDGKRDSNDVGFFAHFWSLAVEEQFYLVFPFLVYFLPVPKLKKVLWVTAAVPLFLRLGVGEFFRNAYPDYFLGMVLAKLPFFHLDSFALGSLLALSRWEKVRKPQLYLYLYLAFCIVQGSVAVYFLQKSGVDISFKSLGFDHPLYQYAQQTHSILDYRYAFTYTFVNIGSMLLILTILHSNHISALLSTAFFVNLGRISYGLYVLHFPLLAFLVNWLETTGYNNQLFRNTWLEFPIFLAYSLVTVGLAWLSFRFFESRFLTLKHKTPLTNFPAKAETV